LTPHSSIRIPVLAEPHDSFPLSLADNFADTNVSQISVHSETLAVVEDNPKKAEPIGDTGKHELISQDPSNSAYKELVAKG
jgi:hypothetical protein